jgi:hypothetical protein
VNRAGGGRRRRFELVLLRLLGLLSLVFPVLGTCGNLYFFFCEDTDYAGCNLIMNYSLVVFPDNVFPEFLGNHGVYFTRK